MNSLTSDKSRYQILRSRLKKARENAGFSQSEAAKFLGKPQWFISRSETGLRRVDIFELIDFARIYNKPLSFFLGSFMESK